MKRAFFVLLLLAAGCQKVTPDVGSTVRGEGVTIINVGSGTKLLKFDDGRIMCFDRFGDVCEDFGQFQTYVVGTAPAVATATATVTVPRGR